MNQARSILSLKAGTGTVCGAMRGTTVTPVTPFQKRKDTVSKSTCMTIGL